MSVLGISAFYHDAAAALVKDGIPIAAAQEERFSRKKNDPSFPVQAIRFCLRQGQIEAKDLDWVVFYEKPLKKFERVLVTLLESFPRGGRAFSRSMASWLGDRLWLKARIASSLGIDDSRVLFSEHHLSHAASSFLPSPFEEAAILTVDGVGEWATTTLGRGQGIGIEILSEIHFPDSIGLLYSTITAFLGFPVHEGEQKVMALAAYGEPAYERQMTSLMELANDGSFRIERRAFRFPFDPEKSFGPRLNELFGPQRMPGEPILFSGADRRHADIAASLQVVTERALLGLVRELHRRVPSKNICLAGGVALNVVANSRILREGPFSAMFVQPAPGDAGGALGAALYVAHCLESAPRTYVQDHAFLGEDVRQAPQAGARALPHDEAVLDEILGRLCRGETVGWVRGRFEWGPRSLGHRTLLADPRRPDMKEHLNARIKHRESFRPFAPAVAAEKVGKLFDLPPGGEWPARFMLLAPSARPEIRDSIPAALHVDGTGRLQVVHRSVDPLFHELLTRFENETGVPALLNTSLNLRGEPIVRGEADAVGVMRRSLLDALIVDRRLYARG